MNAFSRAFAITCLAMAIVSLTKPSSAQQSSSIGYPSVAEALAALRARTDVQITVQGSWTIVSDLANHTVWSFTPSGHPAHPSAVKRVSVKEGDSIGIQMSVLCQSTKEACDRLVAEFQALNERVRQSIQQNAPRRTP
jgi:hypothetical protein